MPSREFIKRYRKEVDRQMRQDDGRFRQHIHVAPLVGWLNDPNGLCELKGTFHAYFQASPFDARGGLKCWGHATSKDLIHWTYEDPALEPDCSYDRDGAYSGSALVEDGHMSLYYTGNVKSANAQCDYITSGREANTILTRSEDAFAFGAKQLLMTQADYPSNLTQHVRDPKVWRAKGEELEASVRLGLGPYFMLQGARTLEDKGEALLFSSPDGFEWQFLQALRQVDSKGYMWECPDYLFVKANDFSSAPKHILSASVQGLAEQMDRAANSHQSGYFHLTTWPWNDSSEVEGDFTPWDYGFDFYAPQSFVADDGRVIMMAWMGAVDECTFDNEPTVTRGWQHCLTIPREVELGPDGKVRTPPVRELFSLRNNPCIEAEGHLGLDETECFDLEIDGIGTKGARVVISNQLVVSLSDHELTVQFEKTERDSIGCGRTVRKALVNAGSSLRIIGDASSIEVFVDQGDTCLSTRYYPKEYGIDVLSPGSRIACWKYETEE